MKDLYEGGKKQRPLLTLLGIFTFGKRLYLLLSDIFTLLLMGGRERKRKGRGRMMNNPPHHHVIVNDTNDT